MNHTEHQLWEMAEGALNGTLDAALSQQLADALAADPAFAAAHTERMDFLRTMQDAGSAASFRSTLRNIHNGMPAQRPALGARIMPLIRQYIRPAAMAAGVALLTSLVTVTALRQGALKTAPATANNIQLLRREIERIKQSQSSQQRQIQDIKAIKTGDANTAPDAPGNFSGTGFALTNNGYLITSYHVTDGADSIYIQTHDGGYHKAHVVAFEPRNDVAVLKVENEKFRFGATEVPYTFSIAGSLLGAQVYTLGYPQDEVVYNEGYISSAHGFGGDTAQYRLEVPAGPGQSGAPVLDAGGNIVGIITGKEQLSEGTTYAITSRTLLRLLHDMPKEARIPLPRTNRMSALNRQQQILKLQDYTCMIRVYKGQ